MALNVVVLGGTKGMGRAVARRLAARGDRVHLLGRDPEELARCAADLQRGCRRRQRSATSVCDLERPETFASAVAEAATALGGFDTRRDHGGDSLPRRRGSKRTARSRSVC